MSLWCVLCIPSNWSASGERGGSRAGGCCSCGSAGVVLLTPQPGVQRHRGGSEVRVVGPIWFGICRTVVSCGDSPLEPPQG